MTKLCNNEILKSNHRNYHLVHIKKDKSNIYDEDDENNNIINELVSFS